MRMIRINCSVSLVTFLWMMILVRADSDVTCVVEESCILPCSFQKDPEVVIKWIKLTDELPRVHSFSKNQDQLGDQDQDFRGRTSLSKDQISRGDASLLLTGVTSEDQGQYQCYTRTISGIERSIINLNLRDKDTDVTCYAIGNCMLPCSFQEGPEVVIQWTKLTDELPRVHSFSNNQDQLGDQDQNFRGRTLLFKDQISRGDASLLLSWMKAEDRGKYECYTRTTSGVKTSIINLETDNNSVAFGFIIFGIVVAVIIGICICLFLFFCIAVCVYTCKDETNS
ncbi:V-set domain-containing T-cell activation inhibitor 1-like isoform X2 [Mugil cephalus]|uniref:V-set domain-containing T-cell activation inhibitor 1-like isoform X2 n=1 Tax=Mugil cephalus TaxID=48193 RepID=UPI001FB6581B|nr:V-set domain-containing T-cell activation inhibitor 1-like isoform X2 [Mugil cephalus]